MREYIIAFILGLIVMFWLMKKHNKYEVVNRKKLAGKYSEKFVPFLKQFRHEPADSFFFGSPIDYVAFDRDSLGNIKNISFIEVKTGNSQLTEREKDLKQAIKNKLISWELIRL